MFNPYTLTYTTFPLDRGTMELNGTWHVRKGIINSDNHLVVIDPRVSKPIKKKDTEWKPLPLIMGIVRERGNVIDYKIPITGNLNSPKLHLYDVIKDIAGNIFIKPATIPYAFKVSNNEAKIEKSLSFKWPMHSAAVSEKQEDFAEKIANFLKDNPDARIVISPEEYAVKEKEYILLFEAKKKFYLAANHTSFSAEDSDKVEKMSINDKGFVKYLKRNVKDTLLFSTQEKCSQIISEDKIEAKLKKLDAQRRTAFLSYFKEKKVEKQVQFAAKRTLVPYNGFSFYRISYKNEFPEELIKSYNKMNDLDDIAPRKKFKAERKKTFFFF